MKKSIVSLMIALCACVFVFAGCSKKQGVIDVPKFKSDNVNVYLKDYAAYCESAAAMSAQEFAQIPARMEEFRKRQAVVVTELQGEAEVNAFNKCITQIREHIEKVREANLKAGAKSAQQQAK